MELKSGKVGGLWVSVLAADSFQPLGKMQFIYNCYFRVLCFMLTPTSTFQAKYSKNDVMKFQHFLAEEY